MPWVRIEDTFYDHPKVLAAGLAAIGLHVVALCYCNSKLTDGAVPKAAVRLLGGTTAQAARLVAAGLWQSTDDGWLIHDFLDYNPSRASVMEHRQRVSEERSKAGRIGGIAAAIAKQRASKSPANGKQPSQQPSSPIPSRPNPSRPVTHAARDDEPVSDEEGDLFAFIAQRGAFIRPDSGFGVRLLGLIDRRGIEVVLEAARALDDGEPKSDRQWVFGLERTLDAIPSPPMEEMLPVDDTKSKAIYDRMYARRLERYRLTGEWPAEWGEKPLEATA